LLNTGTKQRAASTRFWPLEQRPSALRRRQRRKICRWGKLVGDGVAEHEPYQQEPKRNSGLFYYNIYYRQYPNEHW
jgi:hypothetical protein